MEGIRVDSCKIEIFCVILNAELSISQVNTIRVFVLICEPKSANAKLKLYMYKI